MSKEFTKKFFYSIVLFFSISVYSQSHASLQDFDSKKMMINKNAMIILGSWAVGNIIIGSIYNFRLNGEIKYFHQFNAMWNVVNLGIASFGYFNAINSNPTNLSNVEIIKDFNSLQNFLLLNAGLDVAYITAGLYLRERARNSSKQDLFRGYGNSLILQGSFLLLFDVTLFLIHQNVANINLYPHLETFLSNGAGIVIKIKL